MNAIDKKIENITNSGLEQISYNKGQTIYQFNENPKFAYFVYTGEVNIISKNGYNLGKCPIFGCCPIFNECNQNNSKEKLDNSNTENDNQNNLN